MRRRADRRRRHTAAQEAAEGAHKPRVRAEAEASLNEPARVRRTLDEASAVALAGMDAGGAGGGASGVRLAVGMDAGEGSGGAGEAWVASAGSARQALLLAKQALGVNALAMREASEESDELSNEYEWFAAPLRDGLIMRPRDENEVSAGPDTDPRSIEPEAHIMNAERGAVHSSGTGGGGSGGSSRSEGGVDGARAASAERARRALLLVTQELGVSAAAIREARAERDAIKETIARALNDFIGEHDGNVDFPVEVGAQYVDAETCAVLLPPMQLAGKFGYPNCLQLLLQAGAKLDGTDGFYSRTALLWAAEEGQSDCVRRLLDAGADVNKVSSGGQTALILACQCVAPDCVELLLNAGADADAADTDGRTALMHAAWSLGSEARIEEDALICHRLLLEAGADVKRADDADQTVLMYAAEQGSAGGVRLLLEAGADTKKADAQGRTALMLATDGGPWCQEGRRECIQLLLAAARQ